jgi:AcrR family transcriptional regulator
MARTVNKDDHAAKRREILDATQRLISSKGYERMTIQDILRELDMSNGAFFHYFDSKTAVLEAFIEQLRQETEKPLLPLVYDPHLSALEKLQGFFSTFDRWRIAHMDDVVEAARVWYTDENALVRQKVDAAVIAQRAPLLTEIVRQGIREGVFTMPHSEQSGEIILALLHGMGNAHAKLLFSLGQADDEAQIIEAIVAVHAAYMESIERVLGAPAHSLYRADAEAARAWVTALKPVTTPKP